MLFLPQEDPGPFRSRWQPTWVEILHRNACKAESNSDRARVRRRLALEDSSEDSESEESDEEETTEYTGSSITLSDRLVGGDGAHLATGRNRGLERSVSANWSVPTSYNTTKRWRTCASLPEQTPTAREIEEEDDDDGEETATEFGQPDIAADLLLTHSQLKSEASLALAQVEPMAKMQLEVEKRCSLGDIHGDSPCGTNPLSTSPDQLSRLDVDQLHLLTSRLQDQIAGVSKELVQLLIERDDLHMAQDAMLIDVEDHTRRAHELVLLMQRESSMDTCGKSARSGGTKFRLLSRVFSWATSRTSAVQS